MPDRATELAQSLQNAEIAVKELSDKLRINEVATARAKIAAHRAKLAAKLALFGIGIGLVLMVAVVWVLVGVDHNQDRINTLQARQQQLTEQNHSAQCAVNALFLQFEPRTTTNPAYTDEQRQLQVQAYQTLRRISTDLGCPEQ